MKLYIFIFLALVGHICFCQNKIDSTKTDRTEYLADDAFYFQILGDNYLLGVNYERLYYQKNKIKLSARCGFGLMGNSGDILFGNNILFGERIFFIEAGVNPGFVLDNHSYYFICSGNIGIRLQRPERGFFCKLFYNPILYSPKDFGFLYSPKNSGFVPFGLGIGSIF